MYCDAKVSFLNSLDWLIPATSYMTRNTSIQYYLLDETYLVYRDSFCFVIEHRTSDSMLLYSLYVFLTVLGICSYTLVPFSFWYVRRYRKNEGQHFTLDGMNHFSNTFSWSVLGYSIHILGRLATLAGLFTILLLAFSPPSGPRQVPASQHRFTSKFLFGASQKVHSWPDGRVCGNSPISLATLHHLLWTRDGTTSWFVSLSASTWCCGLKWELFLFSSFVRCGRREIVKQLRERKKETTWSFWICPAAPSLVPNFIQSDSWRGSSRFSVPASDGSHRRLGHGV